MLTLTRDFAAQARTASGINILLGVWLLMPPGCSITVQEPPW
jgi:hypothetical protein